MYFTFKIFYFYSDSLFFIETPNDAGGGIADEVYERANFINVWLYFYLHSFKSRTIILSLMYIAYPSPSYTVTLLVFVPNPFVFF